MRRLIYTLAAIVMAGGVARAGILEEMARGNNDTLEYQGEQLTIMRIPQTDGTETIEMRARDGALRDVSNVARSNDGPDKGFIREMLSGPHEVIFHYAVAQGKIVERIEVHSAGDEEASITAYSEPCDFKKDAHCYRISSENTMVSTLTITATDGGTQHGIIVSTWNVRGMDPFGVTQHVRIERLSDAKERITFSDHDKPWAYPFAGYELETLGGKRMLRACRSFSRENVCVTIG